MRGRDSRAVSSYGATIWLTGLSGAGKTTIGGAVVATLGARGCNARLLDADDLRDGLNAGLGFSEADRAENVRRLAEVALLFAASDFYVVVASISPYRDGRRRARRRHDELGIPFFEVHVATPLEVCEHRDPKGLYAGARSGRIVQFTGITDIYEPPNDPDLIVRPQSETVEQAVRRVVDLLPGSPSLTVARHDHHDEQECS